VLHNRIFADAVLLGRYPEAPEPFGPLLSARAGVAAADLAVIGAPLDFYGLNYAFPTVIRAGAPAEVSARTGIAARAMPFSQVPLPEEARTGSGWPKPGYLTTALTELAERYGERLPPIVITENGASFDDPLADGAVDDRRRIDYLAGHLEAALRGVPGVDVQGYVIRSLLDGFEWSAGFSQRFGLVHVDPDSLERTPKASYHWLARMTAAR
jgi:beta-glucosidase